MSDVTEFQGKAAEALPEKLPKPPKFRLGRCLARITGAYACATWKAYSAATGFDENVPGPHPGDDGNF